MPHEQREYIQRKEEEKQKKKGIVPKGLQENNFIDRLFYPKNEPSAENLFPEIVGFTSLDLSLLAPEAKNVIEKLNDPLIHLIRNSCDHGIESPQKRELSGKNLIGTVKLSATHAGSFVLITVSDDGNGLNKEAILNKALANGLISSKDNLSDQQIYELIFKPGFSTTEVVTSLSGRGVGMDVVRKDIDSLGGSISIETESGKGTSFILKIPLTLAIIDGMLVQIGENKYVIPVSNVVECIEYKATNEEDFLCSHIILRDEYFPCINMRNYFEITGNFRNCWGSRSSKVAGGEKLCLKIRLEK